MLLAEIPKVLLLLFSQGVEQLALGPAPPFTHSEKSRLSAFKSRVVRQKPSLLPSSVESLTPLKAEAGCRKAEPFYVALVRQELKSLVPILPPREALWKHRHPCPFVLGDLDLIVGR